MCLLTIQWSLYRTQCSNSLQKDTNVQVFLLHFTVVLQHFFSAQSFQHCHSAPYLQKWQNESLKVHLGEEGPEGGFLPPPVVGVGSVGLGHLVQLILLLDDVALLHRCCQQFLGEFFVHVHAAMFVVPALRDHPFHGQEATAVVRKGDGHLGGGGDQTEYN